MMGAPNTTPGPWHVIEGEYSRKRGRKFPVVFAADNELKYIAYCDDQLYFYKPTDNLANAHQIAASGELYDACNNWIEWLSPDSPWREDAADHEERMLAAMGAALARARGEA